ncbi:MAG: carbohydrate-binding family 9-like protein [Bacteroidota bacterium]
MKPQLVPWVQQFTNEILPVVLLLICMFALDRTYAQQPPQQYYTCYQVRETIEIDGQLNERAWQQAAYTSDFVDISHPTASTPLLRTQVQVLWDTTYLYVAARMEEPHVWATLTQRDTLIYMDDCFELFLDPGGDGIHYGEWEWNAHNTRWDMLILHPYRVPYHAHRIDEWETKHIRHAVHIQGTKNNPTDQDRGWSIEIAIPWTALIPLSPTARRPQRGEWWRANFMRVDWLMDVKGQHYHKRDLPSAARFWVWSPTGAVDIHRPECWGYLQFSDAIVGTAAAAEQIHPAADIHWALWNLHLKQLDYYKKHRQYATSLDQIDYHNNKQYNYDINFEMYSSGRRYEILATSPVSQQMWSIDEGGQLQPVALDNYPHKR